MKKSVLLAVIIVAVSVHAFGQALKQGTIMHTQGVKAAEAEKSYVKVVEKLNLPEQKGKWDKGPRGWYVHFGKAVEEAVKDFYANAKTPDGTPMTDEYKDKYQSSDIKKVYNCLGTKKSPDAYFILFTNAKNEKSVIYFEAISKALSIMKFYNSEATVINNSSFRH